MSRASRRTVSGPVNGGLGEQTEVMMEVMDSLRLRVSQRQASSAVSRSGGCRRPESLFLCVVHSPAFLIMTVVFFRVPANPSHSQWVL